MRVPVLSRIRIGRRSLTGVGAVATALAMVVGSSAIAHADSVGTYIGLSANATFRTNQPHTWTSTSVHLVWQTDGNFVLYCNNSGKVLWASNTSGPNSELAFGYGYMAIYNSYDGNQIWSGGDDSHTQTGDYAYVQNDGNFVIYHPNGGGVEWAINTQNRC